MTDTLLEIEINGQPTAVKAGSTVMDAAIKLGVYVPHFCYHKKLSIAANCRMCLVQVEKAPKPLPACATPVANGMKVFTHSELALTAQKAVMEFLLINHPLDCPICDQGGECQLQDMSMAYGSGKSRYAEEKHIVPVKNVGPLISMQEMSRCIHCTRCVRFGQEVAGIMELGMVGRNMHSEITTFLGHSVDSELSGNMIDICPVGALTSKPFRYTARTWELQRRRSVSPHDSLGANIVAQVKHDKVMRVLPYENESVNECWLSDRDRFSYQGLNSTQRLLSPRIKQGGVWQEVSWASALDYVAHGLKDIVAKHGSEAIAGLASPHATLEEMALLKNLLAGLGSANVDFRLRQSNFAADQHLSGVPWLGLTLEELAEQESVLVIGAFLRKDHPLIAQRLRQATKSTMKLALLGCGDEDPLMTATQVAVAPRQLVATLKALIAAVQARSEQGDAAKEATNTIDIIAAQLLSGNRRAILLGNVATSCEDAAELHWLSQELADLLGANFGFFGEAANSVGGYVAMPPQANVNTQTILATARQAYLLLGCELANDFYNATQALAQVQQGKMVVVINAFADKAAEEYADVMLPMAAFSETSGTFINCEGRIQTFQGVAAPPGEARPGWKILRAIAELVGISGVAYDSSQQVSAPLIPSDQPFLLQVNNRLQAMPEVGATAAAPSGKSGVQRIGRIAPYAADPLVRRATALQQTADAKNAEYAQLSTTLAKTLGVADGGRVRLSQNGASIERTVKISERVPGDCVMLAAHIPLGGLYGDIKVERVI